MEKSKLHKEYFFEEKLFFAILKRDIEALNKYEMLYKGFSVYMKYNKYMLNDNKYKQILIKHYVNFNKSDIELYIHIKNLMLQFIAENKTTMWLLNDVLVYKGNEYNFNRLFNSFLKDIKL